ncbi:hypothetical protein ES705_41025 [subsurface metagenome]
MAKNQGKKFSKKPAKIPSSSVNDHLAAVSRFIQPLLIKGCQSQPIIPSGAFPLFPILSRIRLVSPIIMASSLVGMTTAVVLDSGVVIIFSLAGEALLALSISKPRNSLSHSQTVNLRPASFSPIPPVNTITSTPFIFAA